MIRLMKKEDKETVMGLLRAAGMFTPVELACAEEQVDIYLNQPDQKDYVVVVVENEKGRVAGFMSYGPTPLTEGTYDLYWVAVDPEEQGRGFGKALMHWLEERVKEAGGRMILIETSSQPRYHPTRRFYFHSGYREASRIADFYKPGDDRITYVKIMA